MCLFKCLISQNFKFPPPTPHPPKKMGEKMHTQNTINNLIFQNFKISNVQNTQILFFQICIISSFQPFKNQQKQIIISKKKNKTLKFIISKFLKTHQQHYFCFRLYVAVFKKTSLFSSCFCYFRFVCKTKNKLTKTCKTFVFYVF